MGIVLRKRKNAERGHRTMPGSKRKGRTRQKKPIINSVTSWWYASSLTLPPSLPYFPFPLCSLAPCLLVQKPSKSHPRLKRPFSIRNSNEFPGLWCSIRRLLGGKKGAIELYVDACRSIDFFLRGEGEWSGESLSRTTFLPGFVHRSLFDRPLQFRLRPSFLFTVPPRESLPFLRLFSNTPAMHMHARTVFHPSISHRTSKRA